MNQVKHELGGKIMTEFFGLRTKTNSNLKNNNDEDKKAKDTKKCHKKNLNFKIIKTVQKQLKLKI